LSSRTYVALQNVSWSHALNAPVPAHSCTRRATLRQRTKQKAKALGRFEHACRLQRMFREKRAPIPFKHVKTITFRQYLSIGSHPDLPYSPL
jgi:hypothetical protein